MSSTTPALNIISAEPGLNRNCQYCHNRNLAACITSQIGVAPIYSFYLFFTKSHCSAGVVLDVDKAQQVELSLRILHCCTD